MKTIPTNKAHAQMECYVMLAVLMTLFGFTLQIIPPLVKRFGPKHTLVGMILFLLFCGVLINQRNKRLSKYRGHKKETHKEEEKGE